MPTALLERYIPPIETSALRRPNSDSLTPICAGCYLTEAELRRTGLLGCARCYETFAAVIAAAVPVLHGIVLPPVNPEPASRRALSNPWPTRRGAPVGG